MRVATRRILAGISILGQIGFLGCALGTAAQAAGAVVVSADRSVIYWSTRKPSIEAATNSALTSCKARFPNCAVDKTFTTGCLGVAQSVPGSPRKVWGYALRPSADEARSVAIGQCAQGGASCAIQTVSCE